MWSEERIAGVRSAIEAALERHTGGPAWLARFEGVDPGFAEELRAFVLAGGKRFRPLLLAQAWATLRGEDPASEAAMLDVAVAVELFHAFLLIHDDIMDQADLRRHRPTLRARLQARWGGHRGEGDHLAIVLGDVCFALAVEVLNQVEAPHHQVRALVSAMLGYAAQTGMGQILDLVHGIAAPGTVEAAAIERCYDLKTARYTIECPLKLGAILGGAPPETMAGLERFSRALGVAYQLADDLIGIEGDPDEKSGASDFEQGRQTFLLAETLTRVEEPDRGWLLGRFGRGLLPPEERARLVQLYHASGAVHAVHAHIGRLSGQASAAAAALHPAEQELLAQLIVRLLPGRREAPVPC